MIEFTAQFGDIDEAFYNSLGRGFAEACKLISREQLQSIFRMYCQELVSKTYDFGWGVYDELRSTYQEYVD